MAVYVLDIGINDYVGTNNDLGKCVADAVSFSALFRQHPILLDQKATRNNVLAAVRQYSQFPGPGDWYVGHYSGHGSQIRDRNRDEGDGLDEVIVTADLNYIVDDEYAGLISARNPQAKFLQVFDSCFSGDMARVFSPYNRSDLLPPSDNPRFLNPSFLQGKGIPTKFNKYNHAPLPGVVVFSACTDYEFSYEGQNHGVFTDALLKTYNKNLTIGGWFIGASQYILQGPYGNRQHPQISCLPECLNWKVPSV